MKLTEYYDRLAKHDWFSDFSDDGKVVARGAVALEKLRLIRFESLAHDFLFAAFQNYANGPLSGMKTEMPKRPKED